MIAAHNDAGHRGFYPTNALAAERYWWPFMGRDIAWFVRTCHICQTRQIRNIAIPPVVATPAPLFAKMYMHTMHLPCSGGFNYIVQGRCLLTHYPEFRMLRKETVQALGDWIFQDILCRWGTLVEIVSDNGKPFVAALGYIKKKYHIKHIRISGYNSRANGIIERLHFDVRQALFKAANGEQSKWSQVTYSAFWSECVTPRRRMGCSPYFAVMGTHPLLPFDIIEANYLLPLPGSLLTMTDLIACQAIALQKRQEDLARLKERVHAACNRAAIHFEHKHSATIQDFNFNRSDLVLIRNTAIEKALNCKMRPRYFRPMIVLSRDMGGAYIVCDLDGTLLHAPIAAFRVIPYFAWQEIDAPDLELFIDTSNERISDMEHTTFADPDDPEVAAVIAEDAAEEDTPEDDEENADSDSNGET